MIDAAAEAIAPPFFLFSLFFQSEIQNALMDHVGMYRSSFPFFPPQLFQPPESNLGEVGRRPVPLHRLTIDLSAFPSRRKEEEKALLLLPDRHYLVPSSPW